MTPTAAASLDAGEFLRRYRVFGTGGEACVGCHRFGALWCCPPFDGDPLGETVAAMDHPAVLLMAFSVPLAPVDLDALEPCRAEIDAAVRRMEAENPGTLAFGCGGCRLCGTAPCTRPQGLPCRHPDLARTSLEACGIDLCTAARELLGINLLWKPRDKQTTFLAALLSPRNQLPQI